MTAQAQIDQRTLNVLLLHLHTAKALHSVGIHLVSCEGSKLVF